MKMNRSVEISISTYNRAHILEAWLNENYKQLNKIGIKLSVYDSSTNDDTLNLIKKWNSADEDAKIRYVRKASSIRVDDKVLQSILDSSADYVWPLGDATSIDFEDVSSKVIRFLNENYDFVCVFGSTKNNNDGMTYSSSLLFFENCFWQTTWLGGLIFKRSIFNSLLEKDRYNYFLTKYNRNDGFSYLGIFYELIADKQITSSFVIVRTDGTIGKNKIQGWLKRFMEVWCDNLIYFVDSLPDYYNSRKEKVLKETWKILDLDGIWSYKARCCGTLSKDIYEYYDQMGYLDRILNNKTRLRRFATLPNAFIKLYYLILKIQRKLTRR